MFKTSILVMVVTMISRLLGLVRGTLIASYFGATYLTDAYYSAFKISNFFRQLLGEGALGNTFIPIYNKKVYSEGDESAKKYIFSVLNMLFIFSSIICIVMFVFSDSIIGVIVGGFPEETKHLSSSLLKIMSFYFVFISLSGMMGSILNNFGKFIIPASTSIFFNLAIIAGAVFYSKTYGIYALAYGVVIGGAFQFFVVLIPILRILKGYSFKINFKDPDLKLLFIRLAPMLIGVFARQINMMVDQLCASFLEVGVVTALENASRIYLLPVGVFGVSLANVVFPSLSKSVAKKDYKSVDREIIRGLNFLLFLIIPSIAVLTIYSREVIMLVFAHGKFTSEAVTKTSEALFFYSLGIYFYTAVHLVSKAFYSMGDNKRPAKYSIISIVVNIVLNLLLIRPLGYKGLALATSIASLVNFILLITIFDKKYIKLSFFENIPIIIRTFLATTLAVIVSYYLNIHIFFKLIIFGAIYMLCWVRPFLKYKKDIF